MFKSIFSKVFLLPVLIIMVVLLSSCGEREFVGNIPQETGGDPERGRQALQAYGCGVCHVIPGVPGADGLIAMPLDDWAGRRYVAGQFINTPENLIPWIQDPPALMPGTAMPNLGVTEEDALDMSAYLYTLRRVSPIAGLLDSFQKWARGTFSPVEPAEPVEPPIAVTVADRGWEIYARLCAECHGFGGEGLQGTVPPLKDNPTVTAENPEPVIQMVMHGRELMPGFANRLDDEQIAAVIAYVRFAWGNNSPGVAPAQIEANRLNLDYSP